ncbi:MAG: aldose 1-epimerase [Arenibacter latericius]|nr:aldose 1-epimerase [Arenibacter latericius]
MLNLIQNGKRVTIDAGELVGFNVDGHEYIHQKGSPGWRNSDTEMFPIIGPTQEANFRVETAKGVAVQDQHGLLRELNYKLIQQTENSASFMKQYVAGTKVKNSKFPDKSTEEYLSWPYSFEFLKSYNLNERGLTIQFEIKGEEGMPFMLGYHPAFKLHTANPVVITGEKTVSLDQILEVGNRALPILDCDSLTLSDGKKLKITTEGFGHFMLWTEVSNMVCLEPISFYPYNVQQPQLHTGFQKLKKSGEVFRVTLEVNN